MIHVTVDTTNLTAQLYSATVQIDSNGGSAPVRVTVTVAGPSQTPGPGTPPTLPAVGATLKLSPSSGYPSTPVSVSAVAFGSSETVSLAFDATSAGTGTTDSTGAFTTKITIPSSAQPGTHSIHAVGTVSGRSATVSFLVQTDWPMFGFNAQNTRFNPYENTISPSNVGSLVLDWSYRTGGMVTGGTPAIANGVVYVGSWDHNLYALNAQTGARLWSYTTGNII
jgi:hypothetical protein